MKRIDRVSMALALTVAALAPGTVLAKAAPAARPDVAACGSFTPQEGDIEPSRNKPLPVPPQLRPVMATNVNYMAVRTLGGSALCVFTREMDAIGTPALLDGDRFIGFDWSGYEAGGYALIDRAGKGTFVETGAAPTRSPGGTRFASVEWSESGFGSLNGVLVLGVSADGLVELGRLDDLQSGEDWRIDRWAGEDCFEISSTLWDGSLPAGKQPENPARRRQAVRAIGERWTLGAFGTTCPAK